MNSERQNMGARGRGNEMGNRVPYSEIDMDRDTQDEAITWRGKRGGESDEVYRSRRMSRHRGKRNDLR